MRPELVEGLSAHGGSLDHERELRSSAKQVRRQDSVDVIVKPQ
jgi:hypothetical protein